MSEKNFLNIPIWKKLTILIQYAVTKVYLK